jgi:pimeloyl-ACP methyl ester carboxylesterase
MCAPGWRSATRPGGLTGRLTLAQIPEPHAVVTVTSADGAVLRARRHGNPLGPRLFVSHGNGFGIDGYFHFWRRFLADFDVVALDMRSHGQNGGRTPRADPAHHDYAHMVEDLDAVCRAVAGEWGGKPAAGLFHSMSAQCAMLQALTGRASFEALVLFDPPNVPAPGHPVHTAMVAYEHKLADWARQRRENFDDPDQLAPEYAGTRSGQVWAAGAAALMARAVLQPAQRGGWTLACPRELEASMYLQGIDLGLWLRRKQVGVPVLLVGADPERPYPAATGLSNRALAGEGGFDYRAIPGTSHLLQLEEPDACADAALEFLAGIGLR